MTLRIFNSWLPKSVDWLCRNQYLQSEFLPDSTYRVTRGSGMGLLSQWLSNLTLVSGSLPKGGC